MAAKVGGIYVSLALNTAEFSGGVERSVAEMRKFDKLQADMEKAVNGVNSKMAQQATVVTQLALSNLRLGPTISLLAMHAQQYYQAMERAAKGHESFSKQGAALSAVIQSLAANWAVVAVQLGKMTWDYVSGEMRKAREEAAKLHEELKRLRDIDVAAQRESYNIDLLNRYTAAKGEANKRSIQQIVSERDAQRKIADEMRIMRDKADKEDATMRGVYQSRYAAAMQRIINLTVEAEKIIAEETRNTRQKSFDDLDKLIAKRIEAEATAQEERDKAAAARAKRLADAAKAAADAADEASKQAKLAGQRELEVANAIVESYKKRIELARRYADIATGMGAAGSSASRIASMEALGMVSGVPGDAASARVWNAQNPQAQVSTDEMTRYLRIIAEAAEKELTI